METTSPKTTDPNAVNCHFWNPSSGEGNSPNKTCQGEAKGFIRKSHDNRLCPLCPACKETFVKARQEMNEEVKKSIPGAGEFSDVEITPESLAEYRAQPPKKQPASE